MADAMPTRAPLAALLQQLNDLPPSVKGEIIDGELHVQPRPRFRHGRANTFLGRHLGGSFDFDEDGPGGWWIVVEPGIELPDAPEVSPDLAGWRRERMPLPPEDEPIRIVPDWVCEVLSRSNAAYDRRIKFPFYARVGVRWLWIVNPAEMTVEVRRLEAGRYSVLATFAGDDALQAEPFEAIAIPLGRLWVELAR